MDSAALLAEARGVLAAAGVESPDWDAERLLRHVLGCDRAALLANPGHVVPEADEARFLSLVRRRAAREPLQYILGTQAFWKHEFLVSPAVLVPRPETELLVEASLELLQGVEEPVVVDVGTGSGCIALSIAAEREDALVRATDVSEAALGVARENARRLGLERRVTFHLGDLLEPLSGLEGRVDLVVCNPPYVGPAELAALAPEVREHEPVEALSGGEDGLSAHRRLLPAAAAMLRPGGSIVLELGRGQAAAVCALAGGAGLAVTRRLRDLQGIERVLVARR
jgi:release factor glutamine methyltransferase